MSSDLPTPLGSTVVGQALKNDLDSEGKWNQISFADDTIQTTAGVSGTLARIAGSTFSTIQHLQDIFHSAGWVSEGGVTDDGDGTVTVAAGTGLIRATDSAIAQILFTDWSLEAGANVALADNDVSYVYVEYNAGSPRVIATTTERTDFNTNILLAVIQRAGTTLHINMTDKHVVGDHANGMIRRLKDTMPYGHVSGGIIGEAGTRNITITAGSFWRGLTEFTTSALDTSAAGTFSYWYNDGSWIEVASQTQIDNTQYNNFGVGLATLSNNKYGVHWGYLEADDDKIAIVYGIGDYTLNEAQDVFSPASLPEHLNIEGIRAFKIIIKKSDSVFAQKENLYRSESQGSLASDHGNTAGLSDDDHSIYALLSGRSGGQTLIGGTGSGDDLILQSTSNATKGSIVLAASVVTGTSHLLKRFLATITLDTGDAETLVGLTPNAVIMSAAIRVSDQITALDSADHHIQLGVNGNSSKYIDKAQGASQTTLDVNIKDKYTFDPTTDTESSAVVLTITGGSDNIPAGGAVEVEIIYLDSANLPDA